MRKFKGTKGPWRLDAFEKGISFSINEGTIDVWSDMETNDGLVSIEEAEANANLIAAAPELLEALQMLKKIIDDTPENGLNPIIDTYGDFREKVNKAINKALGQ